MTKIHPCETWLERISRRMDGELAGAESAELDVHLASCPSCRSLEADLAADHRDLVAAFAPCVEGPPPAGLEAAVFARLAAEREDEGRPGGGRILPLRFFAMVAAASLAAAVLLALLPSRIEPGPAAGPPVAVAEPATEPAAPEASVTFASVVNDADAELAATIPEVEAVFRLVLNARHEAELAGLQRDAADLLARTQKLAARNWSNPEASAEIDNVARNLVFLQQSAGALEEVQDRLEREGALFSCENLVGSSAGTNSVDVNWGIQQRVGENFKATPDAAIYWSSYDHLAAGKVAEAIAACDQVLDEFPDGTWADDALYRKGRIYETALRDYERAIAAYRELVRRYPESPLNLGSRLNTSRAQARSGGWSDATLNYKEVQDDLARELPDGAASNRYYQYADSRVRFLESNLEADPTPLNLFVEAETALEAGDRARARALFTRILADHGTCRVADETRVLLADVLRRDGDLAEACRVLEKALEDLPESNARRYAEQVQRAVDLDRRTEAQREATSK